MRVVDAKYLLHTVIFLHTYRCFIRVKRRFCQSKCSGVLSLGVFSRTFRQVTLRIFSDLSNTQTACPYLAHWPSSYGHEIAMSKVDGSGQLTV